MVGTTIVAGICGVLVTLSFRTAMKEGEYPWYINTARVCLVAELVWATVALTCVFMLLFKTPLDEIQRSAKTCYPIPPDVVLNLGSNAILADMQNIQGPVGSASLGSYCVRCLVWRPPAKSEAGRAHHCNICQRCVTGFDHHCNIFGRCITRANMTIFYLMAAMLPVGVITALLPSFVMSGTGF
jgi:hypothetical protein